MCKKISNQVCILITQTAALPATRATTMKTKEEEKEVLKYLNQISKLWNKIDKLTIENKILKNDLKRLQKKVQ